MISQEIEITNKLGLHARASTKLAELAFKFKSEIKLIKGTKFANAKSLMSVMMLAATKGSILQIVANGEDEIEALNQIIVLIHNKFGEME